MVEGADDPDRWVIGQLDEGVAAAFAAQASTDVVTSCIAKRARRVPSEIDHTADPHRIRGLHVGVVTSTGHGSRRFGWQTCRVTTNGAVHVELVEVAPRDGLQSDPTMLSTEAKAELITRAVRAGFRRIEAVSFVNPARVPQMADADELMSVLLADDETRALGPSYIGLVLNRRGLDRALESGVDEANVVVVVTDTFAERNQGRDTDGLVAAALEICSVAHENSLPVSVTLAASFGCPYEGEVPVSRLVDVVARLATVAPNGSRWPIRSGSPCRPM